MRKALFFLGVLDDADIDWLISAGDKREVQPGGSIIKQGKPVESLFLVLDGRFSVERGAGREIASLLCGEVVGEISFVDRRPPAASVKALEKSTVLAIPRRALEDKLGGDARFAARFYKALALFLSHRLRATVDLLGYSSGEAVDEHVDEIDPDTLDNLSLAGARFDWLQRRLKAV